MSSEAEPAEDVRAELIAEQMRHAHAIVRADLDALRAELGHYREMTNLRLADLEAVRGDHEARLRSAADGITQFKVYSGLLNGGSSILSILALIKAFVLGG